MGAIPPCALSIVWYTVTIAYNYSLCPTTEHTPPLLPTGYNTPINSTVPENLIRPHSYGCPCSRVTRPHEGVSVLLWCADMIQFGYTCNGTASYMFVKEQRSVKIALPTAQKSVKTYTKKYPFFCHSRPKIHFLSVAVFDFQGTYIRGLFCLSVCLCLSSSVVALVYNIQPIKSN